jgi:ribose transport system substrate-binding protein
MGHRRARTVRMVTCGIAAGVLLLTACSSSKTGSSPSSGAVDAAGLAQAKAMVARYTAAPTTIPQTTPLPHTPPRGKTLIFLTQNAVPGVVRIGQGEEAAAKAVGWSFSEINYDPANSASLQSALMTALIKHATVVSLTGSDPSQFSASALAAYKKAGVPIVVSTVNSVPSNPTLLGDPGGPPSYAAAARAVAAWFVADSRGRGKVLVPNVSALTILASWAGAFQKEVSALCPACSVRFLNVSIGQAEGGLESALVASTLRQDPGYTYVMYDDGDFATGISSALASAGLAAIKVGGSDFQAQQASELQSGAQSVWTGENLLDIGYTNVDVALRYVEGVDHGADSNAQPTELFTHANISGQSIFSAPTDALQQYEKLWKVPVA